MTPVGYSARNVPTRAPPARSTPISRSRASTPTRAPTPASASSTSRTRPTRCRNVNYTGCTTGQGDIVVHRNILVRSWDSPVSAGGAATQACGGTLVGQGFEGIHIFDISDPANPVMVESTRTDNGKQGLRLAATGNPAGSHRLRLAHRDRRAGRGPRLPLHLQRRLQRRLHGHRRSSRSRSPTRPTRRSCNRAMRVAPVPRQHRADQRRATATPSCAGGNGISMFKFDMTKAADASHGRPTGGVENPTLLWSKQVPTVSIGHSAAFSYDGKTIVFGWEPGGGTSARCEASDPILERTLFFHGHRDRRRASAACCTRASRPASRTAPGTTSTPCRPRAATT